MREEQLDRLLSEFRTIADEQMSDLTMDEEKKSRILQACLADRAEEKVVPLRRRGSALRKWGMAAAAAAVLLVGVLGGTRLLSGEREVSMDAAASVMTEEAAVAAEAPETEAEAPQSGEAPKNDAEESAAVEEFAVAETFDEDSTADETADLAESKAAAPGGSSGTPQAAESYSADADRDEPADEAASADGEAVPEEELMLTTAVTEEEEEESAGADEDAWEDVNIVDGAVGSTGADETADSYDVLPEEEEETEDIEIDNDRMFPGAQSYLTARVVSCETVYLSLPGGTTSVETEEIEQPLWESELQYGTVNGGALELEVATVTVDLVHWGEYISPGTLLRVVLPSSMESGESLTLILGNTEPQLGPDDTLLHVETVAPYYAMGFTGSSEADIEAMAEALG